MASSLVTSPEALLRIVLRTNAITSGFGGLVAAIAPGPLGDLLGTGQDRWIRLVGIGLVAFAAVVVVASRLDRDALVRVVPAISVGDGSWVVGTLLAFSLGWFSTGGAVVMSLVGVMVGVFGVEQAVLNRRISSVNYRTV